ncbi:GNAT family N-acetyltransferase [soil metagenome]
MNNNKTYLFTSERLGFRNWLPSDLQPMTELNADEAVMAFFPSTQSEKQTMEFIERMQKEYDVKGFCYFAVDMLENNEFIGFTGLTEKTFEADFTPCIDIGWRLKKSAWNKGFATEGARRCLDYAFNHLALQTIFAMASAIHVKSEEVMKKAGMQKVKYFENSLLKGYEKIQTCVLYQIDNPSKTLPGQPI